MAIAQVKEAGEGWCSESRTGLCKGPVAGKPASMEAVDSSMDSSPLSWHHVLFVAQ